MIRQLPWEGALLVSWWFIVFLGENTLRYGQDNSEVSHGQKAAGRGPLEGGQGIYELNGFKANANDLAHQAHDVFGVARAVGVGADAAVLVFRHLVLVNHPFEGAAIAQAVFKGLGWDAAQRQGIVHLERTVVFREAHLVFHAVGERHRSADLEVGTL